MGRTVAREHGDAFVISGYKWFSSAADGEVAVALARIEGDRSLSCFLVHTRDENKCDNNGGDRLQRGIKIVQLKDKLGTRQLPTAELELTDVPAELIGVRCKGVQTISGLLNITRLYNSVAATGSMGRALLKAKQYSLGRSVFGATLAQNPLHLHGLLQSEAIYRACLYLTLDCAQLLGATESAESISSSTRGREEVLLRVLTPTAKLFTAKCCVNVISECMECCGGIGYLESFGLAGLLRDAQVLPIWEGTTNVLGIDLIRVLGGPSPAQKFNRAVVQDHCRSAVEGTRWEQVVLTSAEQVLQAYSHSFEAEQTLAREVAFSLARVLACASLVAVCKHGDVSYQAAHGAIVDTFLRTEGTMCGSLVSGLLREPSRATPFDISMAQDLLYRGMQGDPTGGKRSKL